MTPPTMTEPEAVASTPVCEVRAMSVVLDSSEGPKRILAGVDLQVGEGELVSVMGRSGTGKTTLLRVLGGLLEPTPESTVRFHGQAVDGVAHAVVILMAAVNDVFVRQSRIAAGHFRDHVDLGILKAVRED